MQLHRRSASLSDSFGVGGGGRWKCRAGVSADIELQRVVVSILSALDTVGVFGFFKSSGPTPALAPPNFLPSALLLFSLSRSRRRFFPSFSPFILLFPLFPPFFFLFFPRDWHKSSEMHGLSLAFGPRTSRRNIKRWSGPRDKDSCSKREKSKRKR